MGKIVIYILLSIVFCAPIPEKALDSKTIEPKVDLQQARDIALKVMKDKYSDTEYLKDSISIHESTYALSHWEVCIMRSQMQKPPCFVILIDKITGKAEGISNKLE